MPTKAAMDFMPVSGGKRRQSVAAGAGSQVNAASALKRAANKTGTAAVFSMRALAAMASKQEAPSKEQINNPSSGLEVWEYDGAKLNTKSVSCDQSSAYLTNMVKTCNAEFDEREVRNNTGGEEDLESGTLDNTDRPNEVCCRWIHMRGINFEVMDEIGRHLHLGDELVDECKAVASKPSVSWQQPSADMRYDHLFIVAHYLHLSDEDSTDSEVQAFEYEQVSFIYMPEFNLLISIDGNGMKSLDAVAALLHNRRSPVRKWQEAAMLLFAIIDSMLDEVYPLLDLYGDALEGLEYMMMKADEPTMQHVGFSYKIKRLIHSLRRYAWDTRQLMQELRQNQYGVMPGRASKLMGSVEKNADNMVEVAEAYMEQCKGAAEFFESFQEKVVAGTLYILTIASVTIMPTQLLTGLFGMNFVGDASGIGGMSELQWKWGYPMFWILVGVFTSTIIGCMWKQGILKTRETSWSAAISKQEGVAQTEEKREQARNKFKSSKLQSSGSHEKLATSRYLADNAEVV